MIKEINTRLGRKRRHARVRKRSFGTPDRPRLAVFKSLAHIYTQVIDDTQGRTIIAASTLDPEARGRVNGLKKTERAALVGSLIARRAHEKGITKVVFDRGGFLYHGRVKALAEAARKEGLEF